MEFYPVLHAGFTSCSGFMGRKYLGHLHKTTKFTESEVRKGTSSIYLLCLSPPDMLFCPCEQLTGLLICSISSHLLSQPVLSSLDPDRYLKPGLALFRTLHFPFTQEKLWNNAMYLPLPNTVSGFFGISSRIQGTMMASTGMWDVLLHMLLLLLVDE